MPPSTVQFPHSAAPNTRTAPEPKATAAAPTLKQMFLGNSPVHIELLVFLFVSVLDIVMTVRILQQGGRETNPIALWVLNLWGPRGLVALKMVTVAIVAIATQAIALRSVLVARLVLIGGIMVVSAVVLYSWRLAG